MTTRTSRDATGKFTRSIRTAQRDYAAADLRAKGRSLQAIADELGFASRGHAHDAIQRAFTALPAEGAEDAKALDLARIDRLIEAAWGVLERQHVTVSQGKIVGRFTGFAKHPDTGETFHDDAGEPIPLYEELDDDAPVLAAIDRIERLTARRAKIFGYDAPTRSRVEVITRDMVEDEIMKLEAELGERAGHPGAS
jgi:hypothetical protein